MALIELNAMSFYAHHGCFEQEQKIGTWFRVDVAYEADSARAERSDNIADAVNYLEVYQVVKQQMASASHLLEHVAHRIGEAVLSTFVSVENVAVKVSKMNPPLGGDLDSVSVTIRMRRSDL